MITVPVVANEPGVALVMLAATVLVCVAVVVTLPDVVSVICADVTFAAFTTLPASMSLCVVLYVNEVLAVAPGASEVIVATVLPLLVPVTDRFVSVTLPVFSTETE